MFRLSKKEWESLRSQMVISSRESNSSRFVMSSKKHRGNVYLPYAFTEQGVAMPSSVLKSETAIRVNIQIIRIFTRMREMIMTPSATHRSLKNVLAPSFSPVIVQLQLLRMQAKMTAPI